MPKEDLENWWNFSIDAQVRTDEVAREFSGENGINPIIDGDRRAISYHRFLQLDTLLNIQTPATKIPDERIFLVTHQLFELVFKQLLFDMQVVSTTFSQLLSETEDAAFLALAAQKKTDEADTFWRPAVFAANRVAYTCKSVLPTVMTFLSGSASTGGEHFSSAEFEYFRDTLVPSSGFQSAQLRLIQRAFGKTNLLKLRNFPGQTFSKNYENKADDSLVSSVSELILQEGISVAFPSEGDPKADLVRFDEISHQVLVRLADAAKLEQTPSEGFMLAEAVIEKVSSSVMKIMKNQAPHIPAEKVKMIQESFNANFAEILAQENARRAAFETAPIGADYLTTTLPNSRLKQIFDALAEADDAMFGNHKESFLKKHYDVAKFHTGGSEMKGTGGGGIAYLALSLNMLLPLFPALVGYRRSEG